jgi:hypothetical protein
MVPVSLDVYYASTCAPCRLELPVLAEAARDGLPVTIVLLTEADRARRELARVSPELANRARVPPSGPEAGAGPADPRAVLRAAGDPDGILPFAQTRDADGRPCRSWRGLLTLERIRGLLAACRAP